MKIVFLDRGSFPDWIRFPDASDQWIIYEQTHADQVIERAKTADIIITNKVVLDAEKLDELDKLKMIAITATGTNNVDLIKCAERGIAVANVGGYAANTVAEHTLAQLFALNRNLIAYQHSMTQKKWTQSAHFCHFEAPITDLLSSTLCIIGSGAIGKNLAEKARCLGMNVITADNRKSHLPEYYSVHQALPIADHVVLCCPLTSETKGLISETEFSLMKPTSYLVNNSRGGIVDESALVEAINQQQIAGVSMDVSDIEPLPIDSPLYSIIGRNNVLITPHIAWGSSTAMTQLIDKVLSNIDDFQKGKTSAFTVPVEDLTE